MTRPVSKDSLKALEKSAKQRSATIELTTEAVGALLLSTRSRPTNYLCRAYLDFGSDAMSSADLIALREALARAAHRKAP